MRPNTELRKSGGLIQSVRYPLSYFDKTHALELSKSHIRLTVTSVPSEKMTRSPPHPVGTDSKYFQILLGTPLAGMTFPRVGLDCYPVLTDGRSI